ncbi:MAG: YeeE/YedE thiosulfate transporter family protein [Gemmatimonadota bacterium]
MAPFALVDDLGRLGAYGVYLLIGIAFGATLEVAGFANSRKLANQFYLRDMTVLKVMFTGIITAMVLIFLASAAGLLAFNDLFVPPTYLWAGIVGGLVMGVGFILGGFCPGTSLVALSSLKIDGLFFFLGTLVGVFLFGETVAFFEEFWYSSYMGRFILPELLGISTGKTVVLIVLMALGAFYMAEKAERRFGKGASDARPLPIPARLAGAGGLAVLALLVMGMGQPTPLEKWELLEEDQAALLAERQVQIHPGELIAVAANRQMNLVLLDVRGERDFNLFHLLDSRRVDMDAIVGGDLTKELLDLPTNSVVILVSNDEAGAAEAWKMLVGEGIPNVYLLEGGINGWLDLFAVNGACEGCRRLDGEPADDELRWAFDAALGSNRPIANLDLFVDKGFFFTPKVKLEVKARPTGACG